MGLYFCIIPVQIVCGLCGYIFRLQVEAISEAPPYRQHGHAAHGFLSIWISALSTEITDG